MLKFWIPKKFRLWLQPFSWLTVELLNSLLVIGSMLSQQFLDSMVSERSNDWPSERMYSFFDTSICFVMIRISDPRNPRGESLRSDILAIYLPASADRLQVQLSWTPVPRAVGYRYSLYFHSLEENDIGLQMNTYWNFIEILTEFIEHRHQIWTRLHCPCWLKSILHRLLFTLTQVHFL